MIAFYTTYIHQSINSETIRHLIQHVVGTSFIRLLHVPHIEPVFYVLINYVVEERTYISGIS